MPNYLYECPIHGEFEHEHSITEQLEFCPTCPDLGGRPKVKRLIASGTNFILGGSGWAREGYSK
jgi:predicted nucleic acid-binding Zn ribbon protein